MKKLIGCVVVLLVAVPAFSAIEYEFYQKSVTEDAVVPTTDLTAKAIIDGERSRVDFVSGNVYPPGTYVVSTDSRRLFFVDPLKKSYTEFNLTGAATSIGASDIKVTNLHSKVDKLADRPFIAGIETEHTQVTLTYEMTMVVRAIPLTQSVQMIIDNWTTSRFGAVAASITNQLKTGNPDLDQLLDAEAAKLTGFPLRQTITTRTMPLLAPRKSELRLSPTRTIVREMRVTSIRETPADAAMFAVPTTFQRADAPEIPKTAAQVLTFEETKKQE